MVSGGKRMLASPLTRSTRAGVPYRRPPAVEAQLLDVLATSEAESARRAGIADRSSPEALRDECLVHLARLAVRDGDAERFTLATGTLLRRCVGRMRRRFRSLGVAPDEVGDLCQAVVQQLMAAIVAEDGGADGYEVCFGRVLKCRVLNVFDAYERRQQRVDACDRLSDPLGDDETDDGTTREETLGGGEDVALSAERRMVIAEALGAIVDERHREAFVLRHLEDWPIGPRDATRPTISGRFDVEPRTITNWLKAAERDLAEWRAARGSAHA